MRYFGKQPALAQALDPTGIDIERWRTTISRVENGANAVSGGKLLTQYASAFGVSTETMSGYLAGQMTIEDFDARRTTKPSAPVVRHDETDELGAHDLAEAIEELPGLRSYLAKHGDALTVRELTVGVLRYQRARTRHRGRPSDWRAHFASLSDPERR